LWRRTRLVPVQRDITGYHRDEAGDWVAELSCGHRQHVRHRPPFQLRPWVLQAEERTARVGTPLDCPLCDRAELPDALELVRSTPDWDENTMPSGVRRSHRIAKGTWGLIHVRRGQLRFVARTEPPLEIVIGPGSTQPIPPKVEHEVQPLGSVGFSIDFLSIGKLAEASTTDDETEGAGHDESIARGVSTGSGEPACLAHLLCPECGAVLDGGPHLPGCVSPSANDTRGC